MSDDGLVIRPATGQSTRPVPLTSDSLEARRILPAQREVFDTPDSACSSKIRGTAAAGVARVVVLPGYSTLTMISACSVTLTGKVTRGHSAAAVWPVRSSPLARSNLF
jgi:hypothetical protein